MNHEEVRRLVERRAPLHQTRSRTPGRTRRRRTLFALAALALAGVLATGLALWNQGYRVYVVYTGSMSPTLRPGDLIVDRPAGHGYRVGDIITFRKSASSREVVTHRIAAITPQGITTKGDANKTADASTLPPDRVKGSVLVNMRDFGYLVVYLREPSGIASIVTISLAIVLLWATFRTRRPSPSSSEPPHAPSN